MKGFLFDENIPSRLTFTPGLPVRHANELGKSPSDTEIWNFARQERLVIVSKDADFSNRIMLSSPPPWIVRLRFGNMRKREFDVPVPPGNALRANLRSVYPDRSRRPSLHFFPSRALAFGLLSKPCFQHTS